MYTSRIGAYHDGELAAELRQNMEAHLAACAECQTELESVRGMSMMLRGPQLEPLSVNDIRRLRAAAEDLAQGPPMHLFGGFMAAAASILIVCGAWWRTLPATSLPTGGSTVVAQRAVPEWERTMLTLRVDPPASYFDASATALADANLADWMLAELSSKEGLPDGK